MEKWLLHMKHQNHRESKRREEQKENEFGKSAWYRDRTSLKGKEMQWPGWLTYAIAAFRAEWITALGGCETSFSLLLLRLQRVRKPMCRLSISERHQRRCPTCCKISGDKERKLKTKRVWALNLAFCSEFYFHCGTRILGAVLHAGFPGWTVQGTAYFVIIDLVPWNRDYRESCWGK